MSQFGAFDTKTIVFNVPASFNIPSQYVDLSPEETANVLGLLPTIYELLKQETNKTIPEESKKLISQALRLLLVIRKKIRY